MKALVRRAKGLPAWVWGIFPAVLCVVLGVTDRLYTDIDSFYVSTVTNGLYGDSYCQYTHPLLGSIVGSLAQLYPQADWFALLSRAAVTLAVWWCAVLLVKCVPFGARRAWLWLLLVLFLLRNTLYNKNYTIHSAWFTALGIVTLLLALRFPLGRAAPWLSAFFVGLGILWRVKGAVLLAPFFALALVFWVCAPGSAPRRARLGALWRAAAPCAVCAAVLAISYAAFYAVPSHAQRQQFDDARVALNDFDVKPWSEVQTELEALGFTENDYLCASGGIVEDTDVFTVQSLQSIAQAGKLSGLQLTAQGLQTAADDLRAAVVESPLLQWTLALAALAVLAVLCAPCRWYTRLEVLLACGGVALIVLYYALLGRTRDRVVIAVLLGVLCVCLPPLLAVPMQGGIVRTLRRAACVLLAGVCAVLLLRRNYGGVQLACNARVQTEESNTAETLDDDTVYVWNSMLLALQITQQYMEPGKLPDEAFLRQNIPCGEWVCGQSYFNEMLAEINLPNPIAALAVRADTYYVAAEAEPMQTFLREHYGEDLTLTQTASIDVFAVGETPVWQAVRE